PLLRGSVPEEHTRPIIIERKNDIGTDDWLVRLNVVHARNRMAFTCGQFPDWRYVVWIGIHELHGRFVRGTAYNPLYRTHYMHVIDWEPRAVVLDDEWTIEQALSICHILRWNFNFDARSIVDIKSEESDYCRSKTQQSIRPAEERRILFLALVLLC